MPTAELDMDTHLYIGTDVLRFGCGIGDEPRLDYGKITSVRSMPKRNELTMLRTSVVTHPGDSGGGLFHDYKVVGVIVSIRNWHDILLFNIAYAVPSIRFAEWSNENGEALHFVWKTRQLPKMPYWQLQFSNKYEVVAK